MFKIESLYPVEELEKKALECKTKFDSNKDHDLVELKKIDDKLILDIKYATNDNFMGIPLYPTNKAFLQREAAYALKKANDSLRKKNLGLVIFDAYRPWYVTKMFWDATPDEMKHFVANPQNGSSHNRGCAVDVSLYDITKSEIVFMGGGFDEFTERSYPDYTGGTAQERYYRKLLKNEMEKQGFIQFEYEWWHFDFHGWEKHPVLNIKFNEL